MNKRLFLNVMIVAILTFYMIFNIVYRQLIDKHEPEVIVTNDVWESSFLVPETFHLVRLEIPPVILQIDQEGNWSQLNRNINTTDTVEVALSWQSLKAPNISEYQQLPTEGKTVLAFVTEDSQPLVFRVVEQDGFIYFYRMIDQKQFKYSMASKSLLLPVVASNDVSIVK